MKLLKTILIIWVIVLGMAWDSYASLQKVGQGRLGTKQGGLLISDAYEIMSGTWSGYVGAVYYKGGTNALATSGSGEIRYNSEFKTIPTDYVYQFYIYGSAISTTLNTVDIRFRWADDDYYALQFNWDTNSNANCTTAPCIRLLKVASGTPTELSEVAWTPSATEYYQVKLVVSGTSTTTIKVFIKEIDESAVGKDRRQWFNQSHLEVLPAASIDITDSTSPYTSGELRVVTSNPSAYTFNIGYPTLYSSNIVTVSGLSASQYTLYCQAPEVRQPEASQPGVGVTANIFSDSAYGSIKQAQKFRFREAVNLEKLTLFLKKEGSPTGNLVAKICTSYTDCTGGNLVATSDAVTVASWGGVSPFSYPDEQEFLFSSYPSLSVDTDYYFIIEGTTYSTPTSSDYISIWKQTADNVIYGSQFRYGTSWIGNANDDLIFVLRGREKMRLSAQESSGTASIDLSTLWFDSTGTIKVATSATDCYTNIVDSTPETMINVGGDSWQYYSGRKLTIGPMLGCPIDGKVPVWIRGDDYSGGTQYAKIQYTTGTLPSDPTQCSGVCSNSSIMTLSSAGDYTGSVTLSGPTSSTQYNYHVVFCSSSDCSATQTIQQASAKNFTSPPSNSSEVDYKWCGASCFTKEQIPFSHLGNVISADCKEYWAMGDNIYNHHPGNVPFALTKRDYWMRQMDTVMETTYSTFYGSVYNCRIFDNHEWAGTPSGTEGTTNNWWDGAALSNGMIVSHMYKGSLAGVDDYLMKQYASDSIIRAGSRYVKERYGRSVKIAPDHIYENDGNAVDWAAYYGQSYETDPASNPDWESGTTSWTCQDMAGGACASFGTVTTPVQNGSNALRIIDTTGQSAIAQQAITVTANKAYTFRVYYRQTSTMTAGYFRIRTDSYTGGSNICSAQGPTTHSVWTALDCEIPNTNTDTSVYLQMVSTTAGEAPEYSYFDNLTLTVPPLAGSEVKPTCTGTNGTTTLDCTSTTFTTENPAISTTRGIVIFQNRMYSVSAVVDNDTLTLGENLSCTGTPCEDIDTRIWKNGKQMYSRQQMIDIAGVIKGYDEDSTVDIIMLILSKPLTALASVSPGLEHTDFASEYNAYRALLMDYCYDNITKKCSFYTGDRHGFAVFKHTFQNGDADCANDDCQWEFLMGNGGAPNPTDLQSSYLVSPYKEEIVTEFTFRRGLGIVSVNTSNISDTSKPKQGLTFEIRDEVGNKVYSETSPSEPLSSILSSFSLLNYENQVKILRDSSGYCYGLYYDGTDTWVTVSDNTPCSAWTGTEANSRKLKLLAGPSSPCNTLVHFDTKGYGIPIAIANDDSKLFYAFISSNTAGSSAVCARSITITGGSPPTIALNADTATAWATVASYARHSTSIAVASDGVVWASQVYDHTSTSVEGANARRATCGTNCVTSWSGNSGQWEGSQLAPNGTKLIPLTSGEMLFISNKGSDNTLHWSENTTAPSGTDASLATINTSGESSSTSGGWQPSCIGDGSGGAGCVYKQSTWPYSVVFRKYDGSSFGSEIVVSNTDNKNQTSPSIGKMGPQFIVGWLEGGLKTVELYKSGLSPTQASDFTAINAVLDDGWVKTKLQISPVNISPSVLLYWQRVFGVNRNGYGQPVSFMPTILGTVNPIIFYRELLEEE